MRVRSISSFLPTTLTMALLIHAGALAGWAQQQSQPASGTQPSPARLGLELAATSTGSSVTWRAVPGATRYAVHRWRRTGNGSRCCEVHVQAGTALRYMDAPLPAPGTYLYRVVAYLPGGRRHYQELPLQIGGHSTAAAPQPGGGASSGLANPRDFVATQVGDGLVSLTWTRPAGAVTYRLTGPGIGAEGGRLTNPRYTATGVPEGTQEWQLVAHYPQGVSGDLRNPSRATLVVRRPVPPPGVAVGPGQSTSDAPGASTSGPSGAPPSSAGPPEGSSAMAGAEESVTLVDPNRPQHRALRKPPPTGMVATGTPPVASVAPASPAGAPPAGAPPSGGITSMPNRENRMTAMPVQPEPAGSPGGAQPVASGHYLITAIGLYAGSVTTDNMLHEDGKGDEVFAAAVVRRYDRQTAEVLETTRRQTTVFGDVLGRATERAQAGRLSPTGGIGNGDPIPGDAAPTRTLPAQDRVFPWKLWEGTLTEGADAVVISPSIWEYDGRPGLFDAWLANQTALTSTLFFSQRLQDQILMRSFGALALGATEASHPRWLNEARLNAPAVLSVALGLPPILNLEGQDRPIGLVHGPSLPNTAIVLTREIIEAALAQPPLGAAVPTQGVVVPLPKPGMLVVNFEDRWRPSLTDRVAFYSLVLQVERRP